MFAKPMIEYITCESGDWYVLKKFGNVIYEGHSVPDHVWLGLINSILNNSKEELSLKITAISDEEMQEGKY